MTMAPGRAKPRGGASVVGDQPAPDGIPGQRVVAADAERLRAVRDVAADRVDADAQLPPDLHRRVAGRDEAEDLAFAGTQRTTAEPADGVLDDRVGHAAVEIALTPGDRPDRGEELLE